MATNGMDLIFYPIYHFDTRFSYVSYKKFKLHSIQNVSLFNSLFFKSNL
jgi:hypothetical protein